jgi:hypothetical protein
LEKSDSGGVAAKVIIDKSRGELSLLEQDKIEKDKEF